tara:strand:+ start:421 stop:1938 length:1518 start_codon:yes stop_codon:yes gene_type:complete
MAENIRVRFAPSPTGPLHVGGLRTALFNYLFAKQSGGKFILRIEDTDKKRKVDGAEEYIVSALKWCGISADESVVAGGDAGPYRQSERNQLYKKHLQTLIDKDLAYYAFDSEEALDHHREDHQKKGKTFIYNWHNRLKLKNSISLSEEKTQEFLKGAHPYVVRFKAPENQTIKTTDLIRGVVEVKSSLLDDKILYKSDGTPTYHLANVVDDHLMKISHVIRGEEWLPSLALHCLLYEAFGWEKPLFAHIPLILNPSGKGKLSKRSGEKTGVPVYPMAWGKESKINGYKEEGILPEALINFMAMLGWGPGNEKELYTLEELVKDFDISKISLAGAQFDFEKLKWFNLKHLQKKSGEELLELLAGFRCNTKGLSKEKSTEVLNIAKERSNTLKDLWEVCRCFYESPKTYDKKGRKKAVSNNTKAVLENLLEILESLSSEDTKNIQTKLHEFCEQTSKAEKNIKMREIMMPLRMAMVGSLSGLDISFIISCVGIKESCRRISAFIKTL